jgi:hypothetical protein
MRAERIESAHLPPNWWARAPDSENTSNTFVLVLFFVVIAVASHHSVSWHFG